MKSRARPSVCLVGTFDSFLQRKMTLSRGEALCNHSNITLQVVETEVQSNSSD